MFRFKPRLVLNGNKSKLLVGLDPGGTVLDPNIWRSFASLSALNQTTPLCFRSPHERNPEDSFMRKVLNMAEADKPTAL